MFTMSLTDNSTSVEIFSVAVRSNAGTPESLTTVKVRLFSPSVSKMNLYVPSGQSSSKLFIFWKILLSNTKPVSEE